VGFAALPVARAVAVTGAFESDTGLVLEGVLGAGLPRDPRARATSSSSLPMSICSSSSSSSPARRSSCPPGAGDPVRRKMTRLLRWTG
jgi:hypothetical protein